MNESAYKKFDEVYRKYFHNISYFCFSYLQDSELSKDIAQEVFITVWDRIGEIDTKTNLLPYLVTLAKNKCINILTREKVKKRYTSSKAGNTLDDVNALALHEMSASKLYQREIEQIYAKSLSKMPKKTRDTFTQIRVNGSKYKEVSEKENISIKTLEYRITQATLILRKNLRDYLKFLAIIITSLKHFYE